MKTLTNPKTKIVCTLGPSTADDAVVRALIEAGMNVARLNLSHGNLETHAIAVKQVRDISRSLGVPVGIMIDIPGTKYRTGPLETGVIELTIGDIITLTSRDIAGNQDIVSVAPPGIHRDATVGRSILVDDGLIELVVKSVDEGNRDVVCEVIIGGRVTERRGVTTPGRSPSQPFPDDRAKAAMRFAVEQDADFVALSTVTTNTDVNAARDILEENGNKAYIISKVERAEALDNFDEILDASDAIMVARGDMGVEVPLSRVPVIQKQLIRQCNASGKPVITATQMLESMVRSQVPTRAEVTDVANAIFDGTDAIMLSGETSVGRYPVQAVKVMTQVALEAEQALPYREIIMGQAGHISSDVDDAISYDACRTAFQIDASLIITFTESGATAGRVSRYRPKPPILALTRDERIQRMLTLRWAVTPLIVRGLETVDDFFATGHEKALELADIEPGCNVVLVAGVPIGVPGGTNLLRVMKISGGD